MRNNTMRDSWRYLFGVALALDRIEGSNLSSADLLIVDDANLHGLLLAGGDLTRQLIRKRGEGISQI